VRVCVSNGQLCMARNQTLTIRAHGDVRVHGSRRVDDSW
jgi:hypothetical protein